MKKSSDIPLLPPSGVWAINEANIARIESALAQFVPDADLEMDAAERDRPEPQIDGSTAIVNVMGPLEKRVSYFGWLFGFESTETIRRKIDSAASNTSVKTILLRLDSPGGSVDGISELADAIYRARDSKRVVAQVDQGMAASAAYWIASQASEINAGRMDMVGSIGVRLVLWDSSKAFDEAGVRVVPITTGEYKAAGEPGTVITDRHVEHFQQIVDAVFAEFKSAIRRGRGMTAAAVDAVADGRMFMAADAKGLGLIDKIQTLDSTLNALRGKRLAAQASLELRQRRFAFLKGTR